MAVDDKEILHAVKDALQNNPTLAGYVKSFSVGRLDAPRKVFPFLAVGNLKCRISPISLNARGCDSHEYMMEIRAGTRSLAAGVAFGGENGILQLCEDVVTAVRPNDFGVFICPAEVVGVYPGYKTGSGNMEWIGRIIIKGFRRVQRLK